MPLASICRPDEAGTELWRAREVMPVLGYPTWQAFQRVIDKARLHCLDHGVNPLPDFRPVTAPVTLGGGGVRHVRDYLLTRSALYLIVTHSSPDIPEIQAFKGYFAEMTHRQDSGEQFSDESPDQLLERLYAAATGATTLARTHYVYFATCLATKRIKIGISTDLEGRLRSLQTASPGGVSFFGYYPAQPEEEKRLHAKFARFRTSGEWFRPSSELLDFVAAQCGREVSQTVAALYQR